MKKLFGLIYAVSMVAAVLAIVACSDSFTDDRDGQSYDMVEIGGVTWMAENLNYAGDGANDGSAAGNPSSFCPEGDNRKCKEYGRLYTWEVAKSACPAGWRLPTVEEFDAMFMAVMAADTRGAAMAQASNITTVGKLLKSTSGWFKNGNGTDAVGFKALPAGYMSAAETDSEKAVGKFDGIGGYAHIWSATADPEEPTFAQYLYLDFSSDAARISSFSAADARSVRCVRQ